MEQGKINSIIGQMTLEEKALFCAGKDFWHLQGLNRLGIPQTMVADGPHGLRKQTQAADHMGLSDSNPAICFPTGSALASGFDPSLSYRMGEELGKLAQAEEISTVLGPAMNIKRSPLCGRNFEYYSEDPYLTGEIAKGTVDGVQSQCVGTSPKHFLANNQEYFRMSSNSVIDEQTLREIYLPAFEKVVKEAKPWTLMCSYNRINGIHASESKEFLNDVLRDEWGFDGYVMTDWGACADPVSSLKAGLDLEMPGPSSDNVRHLIAAVENGELDEAVLNRAVARILNIVFRFMENRKKDTEYDFEAGHKAAADIAAECAVLLKNEDQILPLKAEEQVLLVGPYAAVPRYQGGGSSHIHSYKVTGTWEVLKEYPNVRYEEGFVEEIQEDAARQKNEVLLQQAVEAAKKVDKVVIFAGLPDSWETEGIDRTRMDIPKNQAALIQEIAKVQENVIVVLHNGSAVEMAWIDSAKAVLEMYLGGEAVGIATAELLYGKKNPCGHLAETFPLRLEDTPAYPYFGVERDDVVYREGILVGYRYYTTKKQAVLFPFGHGLSYTSFAFSDLTLDKRRMQAGETVQARVTVKNTGEKAGKALVQLYVSGQDTRVVRPMRELKAFRAVYLEPGESREVTFTLQERAFAYWNVQVHDWYVPAGDYRLQIGENAEKILLEQMITIESEALKIPVTIDSPMGDVMSTSAGQQIMGQMMASAMGSVEKIDDESTEVMNKEAMAATGNAMTLRSLLAFSPDIRIEQLQQLVKAVNDAQSLGTVWK